MSQNLEQPKSELLIAILAVVIAGVVQVTVSPGPYNFWNVMIATLLGWVLYMYPLTRKQEIPPLAVTWGFVLVMGTGIILQELYRSLLWLGLKLPPFSEHKEAPSGYYFAWWIIYSFASYIFLTRRLKGTAVTPEDLPHDDAKLNTSPDRVLSPISQKGTQPELELRKAKEDRSDRDLSTKERPK